MGERDKAKPEPKARTQLIEIVATATAGAVAAMTPMGPAVAAGLAIAPGLLARAVGALGSSFGNRNARRFELWLQDLGAAMAYDPEQLVDVLEQNVGEEWAQEALLEAVKSLTSSISDDAIPIIAAITAEYAGQKRRPDGLHRRAAELVCRLETEEIDALRELLLTIRANKESLTSDVLLETRWEPECGGDSHCVLRAYGTSRPIDGEDEEGTFLDLPSSDHDHRMFFLLKGADLGRSAIGDKWQTAEGNVLISLATAIRLAVYFSHKRKPRP